MADDNRLDLSAELEKVQSDLLSDVKAATDQVKQRKAALRQDADRSAERAKSRKLSAVIAGIGAVVVLLLSYWMVFARPDGSDGRVAAPTGIPQSRRAPAVSIKCPVTTPSHGSAAGAATGTTAARDSQVVEHPSDEYEPPSGDSGM